MSILVSNMFNKGLCTIISNLIRSSSVASEIKKNLPLWALEYCHGMSHEIYTISFINDVNKLFVGSSYHQAVSYLYKNYGILMIGIKSKNLQESIKFNHYDIFINPINYLIEAADEGIVLAKNQEETEQVFNKITG